MRLTRHSGAVQLLILLLLLGAACGTGTNGKPVAPTSPAPESAPPPAPTPPPPTFEAVVWLYADSAEGYYVGDWIRAVVESEQPTTVEGSPRLAIEIGEHVRLADFSPWVEDDFPPERPSFLQRFEYQVQADDEDADGISIAADALDFSDGAILSAAGVEIEVEITAAAPERNSPNPVQPGEPLDTHRVIGQPEPRACTDERERALAFHGGPVPVREWDGTPFRVDMIRNFPDFVTEADLVDLLAAVGLVDDKIEAQLGYRIVEMGDVIPVPNGLPEGWNTDERRHRRTCPLPRERGQIQGFYMDGENHGSPRAGAQANSACSDFCYLRPGMERWREGREYDGVTLHEIFHLLGFNHDLEVDPSSRGLGGVSMSKRLTRASGPDAEVVLWSDIDALRCIFPEGG